jgi:hypothetical protein
VFSFKEVFVARAVVRFFVYTPLYKGCNGSVNFSLDGKTPAEACGIAIEGENKWKIIIQNASKEKRKD